MTRKYPNLLSPIKIGNVIFKNRLIASSSRPTYVQGPETYPAEGLITHYSKKAQNGAAVVTCCDASPVPVESARGHAIDLDIFNERCQHYLSELTEAIHFYGSKASMQIRPDVPPQYDVSGGIPSYTVYGTGSVPRLGEEIPADLLDGIADDYARQCATLQELGFDMIFLHMTYRALLPARFLSPITNKRTDDFGGSLENRVRFPIMIFDRIKEKCGRDFLIEVSLSGCEPPGGYTLEDAIEYARLFAGHIDLLQLRAGELDPAHPTGYSPERTPFLYMAEAVKKSGADVAVVTVGGFQDLDFCEEVIASGGADFIAMARSWISNPDYGRLAYEGRNEDIVPCIRCNKCHRSSPADPWVSVCSVNPVWGFEHRIETMIEPPVDKKKVAIVGGGPAGMKAALVAAERGHRVTLYEKSDVLGGLLKTTDHVSFKWPLQDFKNYLIRQIGKSNVEVCLNTEATPAMLESKEYDAVLAAVGSEPVVPPIPGVDGKNVFFAPDVYGNEDSLAENVAVIGGGEVGVETGMHLAERGHRVTLLEMEDKLAKDAPPVHFYTLFQAAWERLENFSYILNARCTAVSDDGVIYEDAGGAEHAVPAGSVVIAVGMKAKSDLALEFRNSGERFFAIGDCNVAGNVQKVVRSAFSIASML